MDTDQGLKTPQVSKENLEKFHDKMHELSGQLMELQYRPKTKVYIDLSLLFDFNIGAMLHALTSFTGDQEHLYQYLLQHIPKYEKYYDHDWTKMFPEFFKYIPVDLINQRLQQERFYHELLQYSPTTTAFYDIESVLLSLMITNQSSPIYQDEKLALTVYSAFPLHPDRQQSLSNYLLQHIPGSTIEFTSVPLSAPCDKARLESLKSYDIFFISSLEPFLASNGPSKSGSVWKKLQSTPSPLTEAFLSGRAFNRSIFFCKKYVSASARKISNEPAEELIRRTEPSLNLFCDFYYIDTEILIEG